MPRVASAGIAKRNQLSHSKSAGGAGFRLMRNRYLSGHRRVWNRRRSPKRCGGWPNPSLVSLKSLKKLKRLKSVT